MVTRKNFGKHLGKAIKSIGKASPEKVGKYVSRGLNNLSQGGVALAGAAQALESGDVKGAAVGARTAANKVIGKNNIKAAGQVILGKKGAEKFSKGVKVINRVDKAAEQYQKGDVLGASKTAMGKKAYDKATQGGVSGPSDHSGKVAHHIARAKHHTEQLQAIHTAVTGQVPKPIGATGVKPYY